MENLKKVYVHWDIFRFLEENHLDENTCICVCDSNNGILFDIMIYLYKKNQQFKVKIYKSEDENNFDEFTFEDFGTAHEFVDTLSWKHPEYKTRPFICLDIKNETIWIQDF